MDRKLESIVILIVLLSFCLSGCTTISGYPDTSKTNLPSNTDSTFLLSDAEYSAITNESTRSSTIHKKIRDIDLAYSEFESKIYKENIVADLSTDITVLALSGATVIVGGTQTKEALAAITTFILGSKASFDKRALFENTMAVLVQKMRADRAQVKNDILRGISQPFDKYNADGVSIDIARYYYSGTIPSALTGLAKVAVDEESKAKEEQKKIAEDQFLSDASRKCLIAYWKPNDVVDVNNQNEITTWKNNSKYKDMQFGFFMNGAGAARARIDAVNYLITTGKIYDCQL